MAILFRTVLVPTDFSDLSKAAIEYAFGVAERGARIILCHVVDDLPLAYGYVGAAAAGPELRTTLAREASAAMDQFAPNPPAGIVIDRQIVHGTPFAAIVDLARKEAVDLIVMSTHGRTGLKHALIGSVAERVVRKAPCPVLVVRPKSMVVGDD